MPQNLNHVECLAKEIIRQSEKFNLQEKVCDWLLNKK